MGKVEIRVGIITVSDRSSRGEREDLSGPILVQQAQVLGWQIVKTEIVPDELDEIKAILCRWCDEQAYDVVLTTGGTGMAPRDITPEATKAVIEREVPGMAEAMRAASLVITPHAMISRGIVGIRGNTLVINLPGSPKASVENLQVVVPVIPHAVQLLQNDPMAEAGH